MTGLEKAKDAGFRAFEFWGWWDKDIKAIAKKAETLSMECATFCTRFIPLTDPDQREAYLSGLKETLETAKILGCKKIISQVGDDTGRDRAFQTASVVEGLKAAAPLLEKADVILMIEPLNGTIDHKGTFLERSTEGFEIVDHAANGQVKLLFDIYHQQITEGDIIRRIQNGISRIGHFHAAGNPGRHEPYTGELDYRNIIKAIDASGFPGYMGLEYFPEASPEEASPEEGISKLKSYLGI